MLTGEYGAASYGNPGRYPQNLLPYLNLLHSVGVDSIRIDLGYAPWLNNHQEAISNITSMIQNIRSYGKALIFADAASETYWTNPETWAQFKLDWVSRVQTLASMYRPDYYIVIKEPGWYTPMISDANTNPQVQNASDWVTLTSSLVNAVTSVSPSTKLGIAISGDTGQHANFYIQYLQGCKQIPKLNFIGFDIYTRTAFQDTATFLNQYGVGSKNLWVAEAWSATAANAFNSSRATLDKTWVQVLYYFAETYHAVEISPFFSSIFASYISPPQSFIPSTHVGLEYQHIIQTNRAGIFP